MGVGHKAQRAEEEGFQLHCYEPFCPDRLSICLCVCRRLTYLSSYLKSSMYASINIQLSTNGYHIPLACDKLLRTVILAAELKHCLTRAGPT